MNKPLYPQNTLKPINPSTSAPVKYNNVAKKCAEKEEEEDKEEGNADGMVMYENEYLGGRGMSVAEVESRAWWEAYQSAMGISSLSLLIIGRIGLEQDTVAMDKQDKQL